MEADIVGNKSDKMKADEPAGPLAAASPGAIRQLHPVASPMLGLIGARSVRWSRASTPPRSG